jgi:molecular chaperone HtpG
MAELQNSSVIFSAILSQNRVQTTMARPLTLSRLKNKLLKTYIMENNIKNGTIGVTTENIFPVIKQFLYSDQEIFLRELVANAVDAVEKLKTLATTGSFDGELGETAIKVAIDKDNKTLTITDRGIGMTADEVNRYINQIAFSSAEEWVAKYKNQSIIGHFGLGFYSAFMVSERVEIFT